MLQPWDVQVWEAVPLPDEAHYIPNNALICTRKGLGACGIRGADCDGDPFMVSNSPPLLALLHATPQGSEIPELTRAASGVKAHIAKTPKDAVSSLSGFQHFSSGSTRCLCEASCALWPKRHSSLH